MERFVKLSSVIDIAMKYCPDDDGSCSEAGNDLREMLDEIEAINGEDVLPRDDIERNIHYALGFLDCVSADGNIDHASYSTLHDMINEIGMD